MNIKKKSYFTYGCKWNSVSTFIFYIFSLSWM